MTFRREIRFEPGYDHRNDGGGCHGLSIRFLLHGDKGTIQFLIYTDWLPTHITEDAWGKRIDRDKREVIRLANIYPMAADLGRHWRTRLGYNEAPYECDILDGADQCFYEGSALRADQVLADLLTGGDSAVWDTLEAEYASITIQHTERGAS
jgi:hypothetical protein